MNFRRTFGLSVLLIIGVNACAPRPVFRLKSLADQSTWYQGTEYIHSNADSISVTAAYIRHVGDKVVFDVEVANYSDEVVRIDPALFSYKAYKLRNSAIVLATGGAVNPELELLRIDMEIAEEEASQRTTLLLSAIGATAMVAEEITDDEEDTVQDEVEEAAAWQGLVASTSSSLHESEYEIGSLQHRRKRWTIETLRKTDLFPGEFIRGKVYYPTSEDARYLNIEIEIGNTFHIFRFRQLKY